MTLIERMNAAQQVPYEIEELGRLVIDHAPKIIVEIGTAKGGTLVRWLRVPGVELVISVDLPDGIYGGASLADRDELKRLASEEAQRRGVRFLAIDGPSSMPTTVSKARTLLQADRIDFLFIDGDHTYNGVRADWEAYAPLLADNAVAAFHDIVDSEHHRNMGCNVAKLWDELKTMYLTEEIRAYPPLVWAGIGIVKL